MASRARDTYDTSGAPTAYRKPYEDINKYTSDDEPEQMKRKVVPESQRRKDEDSHPRGEARPPLQPRESELRAVPAVRSGFHESSRFDRDRDYDSYHEREVCNTSDRNDHHPGLVKRQDSWGGQQKRSNKERSSQRSGASGVTNRLQKWGQKVKDSYVNEEGPVPESFDSRGNVEGQRMRQEIHHLRAIADGQNSKIAELSSKLKTEEENNRGLMESTDRMILAMENKDLFVGRQDTDKVVKAQFTRLMSQIKTWSVAFAEHERPPPLAELPEIPKEVLRRILPCVPDFGRFLQSPKNIRLFVRGWVGLAITEMVFRTLPDVSDPEPPNHDAWMDKEMAQAVHLIEMRFFHADRKAISLRELNDWRAFTTGLVSKQDEPKRSEKTTDECVDRCMQHILGVVEPLAPSKKKAHLSDELLPILVQAVRLSQALRCQRAAWSVRHVISPRQTSPESLIMLEESVMENLAGDDDSDDDVAPPPYKIVDVVISPALFKRGDTDGERFDLETCSERAQVKAHSTAVPTQTGKPKHRGQW